MITVVFFASLREELGVESISLEATNIRDIQGVLVGLEPHLEPHLDGSWRDTLTRSNILIAINQEMGDINSVITDGDEVAFFPPVTGG